MLLIYLGMIDDTKEQDKFTLLYMAYRKKMFYKANQILEDAYLAEDAVHEAFLRVTKNLHKISDVHCPQTMNFLVTIVKNVALSMKNSNASRDIIMTEENYFDEKDSGFNLENECLSNINYERIVNEIQKLPDIYKDAVYLDCVMNMQIVEISKKLSISNETAKKRVQRGRILLIEKLKKEAIIYAK
jgi:RNA polymerase sigma-70 factor (ECF subfamily)